MPTVLIVDDQSENLYLLQALLTGHGYEICVAEQGHAALELALHQPPDLIVSDVLMPVMDGFRLCRAWKQHPLLQQIPFVFYTATYTDPQDEQLALSLGADAFIIKPIEPDAFMAQINAVLARYSTGDLVASTSDLADGAYIHAYNSSLIHKLDQKMTELEATNQRLHASEARLRAIACASPDLICVLAADSTVLELLTPDTALLPAGCIAIGRGRFTDLLSPAEDAQHLRDLLQQTLATGVAQEITQTLDLPLGERWFEGRMAPLSAAIMGVPAVVLAARDITLRKHAEKQLQHAQKIEVIGRLTAGIAHDFNNLLTVINGYTDLLLEKTSPDIQEILEQIRHAGERASTLTRQLLAFSRKQVFQPAVTDINWVVRGVEKLLRRVIGEDVELCVDLAPDLWMVLVDPIQAEQVLLNLAINARDAMPDGGRLAIRTANLVFDADDLRTRDPDVPRGDYVLLAVSDTGSGMSAAVQAQIFEPFFTTKEPGTGTGLGLSVVYGIVIQSGGHITVTSAPDLGTTMSVHLPRFGTS